LTGQGQSEEDNDLEKEGTKNWGAKMG